MTSLHGFETVKPDSAIIENSYERYCEMFELVTWSKSVGFEYRMLDETFVIHY